METVKLTSELLWICSLLAVVFVGLAISTLVLYIKNSSLKSGNENLRKMYEENAHNSHENYEAMQAKDKALELLMDALDKEFWETQLSNGMKIIGDAVIKKNDSTAQRVLCEKITDYFTQKAKKEADRRNAFKSYVEHGGCVDE